MEKLNFELNQVMKTVIKIFAFLLFVNVSFSQDAPKNGDAVKTVGYFDMRGTKAGYEINGYVVELTPEQVKMYDDRKLEVSGTVLIGKNENEVDIYIVKDVVVKILE